MRIEWIEEKDGELVKMVDYEWYEAEKEIMNKRVRKLFGFDAQIYEDDWQVSKHPVEMKVNWSAYGAVSTKEAKEFIGKLQELINIAEDFKYNGYIVAESEDFDDWNKDEQQELLDYIESEKAYWELA